MNGRCTTDPLDHASDVCEFCAEEFCSACLITTKGCGAVCRDCARASSGVRSRSAPRATKSEVKRARIALEAAKATRAPKTFTFFDEDDDYVPPTDPTAHTEVKQHGKRRGFGLRRSGSQAQLPDEAIELHEVLVEPAPPTAPRNEEREAVAEVPHIAAPDAAPIAARLADRLTGASAIHTPSPTAPTVPAVAVAFEGSATAQLQQLRETSTPATEQSDRSDRSGHTDLSFPVGPIDDHPYASSNQTFAWTEQPTAVESIISISATELGNDPFALGDPFATAEHLAPAPATEPVRVFEPAPAYQAPPVVDAPPVVHAPPVVDAPPTVAPAPAFEPTPVAEPARIHRPVPVAEAVVPTPSPVVDQQPLASVAALPTEQAPTAEAAAPTADHDSNGNWIPPVLRGIAPDAEQRAGDLPRRRRGE